MVAYCSVPQCRTYATEPDVSFHHYPKCKKMRETWLVKLKMGKNANANSRVCSKHFREEDFEYAAASKMFADLWQAGRDVGLRLKLSRPSTFLCGLRTARNAPSAVRIGRKTKKTDLWLWPSLKPWMHCPLVKESPAQLQWTVLVKSLPSLKMALKMCLLKSPL